MLSTEKNNGPRKSSDKLPQDRSKNNNPASPTGENAARNRSNDDRPEAARISREDAERNLRPDPDPDDPVSP